MKRLAVGLALLLAVLSPPAAATDTPESALQWSRLPDLPDPLGLGGPFVGTSNNALIVAGGSNFPVSPFQGGTK
jgi:SSS family solute:Na+ symporter